MDENTPRSLWAFNNGTTINTSGRTISRSGSFGDTIGNGVPYSRHVGGNLIGWCQVDVQNGYVNRVLWVAMPSRSMYAWGPDQT